MPTIKLADLEEAHHRWCEELSLFEHTNYFKMHGSFVRVCGYDVELQWAGRHSSIVFASDQLVTLVNQLLSPHYKTIIKAYAIKHTILKEAS